MSRKVAPAMAAAAAAAMDEIERVPRGRQMKALGRRLLRPICWLRGHRDAFWMLPEFFGLYRYSRWFCRRCEWTFESHPPSPAEAFAFWYAEAEVV